MKRYLIIIGVICVGCKSRKVLTTRVDSSLVSSVKEAYQYKDSYIDTGTLKSQKNTTVFDTTATKITIVPVSGKEITVNKSGAFVGEASLVEIAIKNHVATNQFAIDITRNGVSQVQLTNSIIKTNQQLDVVKKAKSAITKPNYIWIAWVAGLALVIFAVYRLYKKYRLANILA